jgi:uncharacterized membrane protein
MEQGIKIAIYIHAFFGGLGLIMGLISVLVKKGNKTHKKAGKLFSVSMIISCLISLVIACIPKHENVFLFLIGLFTIYLVLSGNRALSFKSHLKTHANFCDKLISGSMIISAVFMLGYVIYDVIFNSKFDVLFLVFGGLGLFLGLKDFRFFKTFKTNKKAWLKSHIGKIVGAFIASVTAFIVAGLSITSLVSWLIPTVVGTIYIIYWSRKIQA